MVRAFLPAILAATAMTPPASAQTAPRPMTAVDLLGLPQATGPRPSPDGGTILYKIRQANWDRNRMSSQVWRKARSGAAERVTGARGEIEWGPDGRTLAHVTERDDDKARQIYVQVDDGKPRRLTQFQTDVSDIQWSGDGKRIYFTANRPDDAATATRLKSRDDMVPFESPRRRMILGSVDVASGKVDILVAGDYDVRGYSVAAGGGRILYAVAPSRLADERHWSELWLLDTATGTRRQLTKNDYVESDAALSPDGRSALFVANADGGRYATVNSRLFVLDVDTGAIRQLAAGRPWAIEEALWSADGSQVYVAAQDGVRTNPYAVAVADGTVTPLETCDCTVSAMRLSRDGRTLAYLRASASQPAEIVRVDPVAKSAPVQVTHLNDDIATRFQLPRQEAVRWAGPEGQALEGLVTYPIGYVAGRRYPLVVQNHGGPRVADQFGIFNYSRFQPLLAAHGVVMLTVNYRGGTGYGDTFLQGMNGGYYRFADRDVLSGVDELVKRGIADPARLGTMGWSAGGHMTARLITVTDRFKAAIVGAGAVDWASLYLGSDTRWQRRETFLTPPYGSTARRDLYQDHSPLSTIDKAKTPTLILAGAEDRRVPPAQSVMLYRALKDQGVPTELYLAPREPHTFSELRHRLFQVNAGMRWLSAHVLGTSYVPAAAPGTAATPADPAEERLDEPEEPGSGDVAIVAS